MRRRDVLATAGVALSGSLGGCSIPGKGEPATATDRPRAGVVCRSEERWAETEPLDEQVVDTPAGDRHVREWERCDLPPYPIEWPDAETEAEWNADYLGEGMATEPSVPFEVTTATIRRDEVGGRSAYPPGAYVVEVLDGPDAEPSVPTGTFGARVRERVEDADFTSSVLVLVADCCGLPDSGQGWERVESDGDALHLHGYRKPSWGGALIQSVRFSLLEVERPASAVEVACASYTTDETARLHFDSTDGLVEFQGALAANDREEPVAVDVRVTTEDGEVRVDDRIRVPAGVQWSNVGYIGLVGDTYEVSVASEELGAGQELTYADPHTLGIRVRTDGTIDVGPSDDLY